MKNTLLIFLMLTAYVVYPQGITKMETIQSLFLEVYRDNTRLGTATGFIIKSKTQYYLVTNYHVVTNKSPVDGSWLPNTLPLTPNKVIISHISADTTEFVKKEERLLDENFLPLYFQDSIGKELVDVVQLPLKDTLNIGFIPVNYRESKLDDLVITPTDIIYIVGFPLGIKGDQGLASWKSGSIASEPYYNQQGKPIIWVDVDVHPGMSGSPVYFISKGFSPLKTGGSMTVIGGRGKFMGVFSHITKGGVYGALWKADYLKPIFDKLP